MAPRTRRSDSISTYFELESVNYILDPSWQGPLQEGKIEEAEVFEAMNRYNNVVGEIQCVLKAVKP